MVVLLLVVYFLVLEKTNSMYNKISFILLICLFVLIPGCNKTTAYKEKSTAVVTLVGAYIKCKDSPIIQKYERKNCPVCKGTGKYLSGDGIKMVDCGYCEETKPKATGVKK